MRDCFVKASKAKRQQDWEECTGRAVTPVRWIAHEEKEENYDKK
jgi:hypothetical protein